jgi:hypothetical protein
MECPRTAARRGPKAVRRGKKSARRLIAAGGLLVALVFLTAALLVASGTLLAAGPDSPTGVFSSGSQTVVGNEAGYTVVDTADVALDFTPAAPVSR